MPLNSEFESRPHSLPYSTTRSKGMVKLGHECGRDSNSRARAPFQGGREVLLDRHGDRHHVRDRHRGGTPGPTTTANQHESRPFSVRREETPE